MREYPSSKGEPFYPIPIEENMQLYEKYKEEAEKIKEKVLFIGRLARYEYIDMDEAVLQALKLCETI